MNHDEQDVFALEAFLAQAGLGRRIVRLKKKEASFLRGMRPIVFFISRVAVPS